MSFTEKDIEQIDNKGLTLTEVYSQIELFKTGIPYANLVASATIGDGIMQVEKDLENTLKTHYADAKTQYNIVKFVPASGAATRMFKFLFKFLKDCKETSIAIDDFIEKNNSGALNKFILGLSNFPFYDQVLNHLKLRDIDFHNLSQGQQIVQFVKTMLEEEHLNFGNFPKGLLPFHKYSDTRITTAFEEHLYEAALYASNGTVANIHFTISPKHEALFKEEFKRIQTQAEKETGIKFKINYSFQESSTDTLAVSPDNTPFRNEDGSILFRPSGHGALLQNLNKIDADIIFIKNIDNVVVKPYREEMAGYKSLLAGLLLKLQHQSFAYLKILSEVVPSEDDINEIAEFLVHNMSVKMSNAFERFSASDKAKYLHDKLNRPIRICGMVKNEGEPGGGPFWIIDQNNNQSLQIVESAQIDQKNEAQQRILMDSTHFNPVDLVCAVKNYKGEKFDLMNFVDPKTAFITMKTKEGRDLKALELPGLWNGSMADWITIFVEVPVSTFNPVKTVNDLLKAQHQFN